MYAHDLLDGLNDEQRAVAQFDEPAALRVLAGAGTGKTTALTARVARIVADGTPAERVLLLTFTRRAARQMIDRSHTRLAHAGLRSGRVSGGTFHSVAHRTLRQHAARLGLPEGFSVLDPSDAADVMDVVRDETVKSLPN
ncbi:MAG: UvrD-helicase domain-containing protein, partial [Actinobacteria bacterium]|nr:UvrD-helicase domain-containing protein [Actinomycetota bacterium]